MADEEILAELHDHAGRPVVLLARIWNGKIARDHPELVKHLDSVLDVVTAPDIDEADRLTGRRRFYRRTTTPSRWLMVVVSYEQDPARIITAMALRKDPTSWNR